ncbi:unnamed protein product [Caenorhabditis bovis]|uniref:Uncharacterized protein n=1 Tax=Caenorhabditis bovis TaxID=2654633 RepID=A0A8S1EPC0_9PELO|nr:unnamed protein product [Caenorhabditis bovis]
MKLRRRGATSAHDEMWIYSVTLAKRASAPETAARIGWGVVADGRLRCSSSLVFTLQFVDRKSSSWLQYTAVQKAVQKKGEEEAEEDEESEGG